MAQEFHVGDRVKVDIGPDKAKVGPAYGTVVGKVYSVKSERMMYEVKLDGHKTTHYLSANVLA